MNQNNTNNDDRDSSKPIQDQTEGTVEPNSNDADGDVKDSEASQAGESNQADMN